MMNESCVHQVGLQKGAGVVVTRRTLLRGLSQGERTSAEGGQELSWGMQRLNQP